MRSLITVLGLFLLACSAAVGQDEKPSNAFYPAENEIIELQKVLADESFDDPARVAKIEHGRLFLDVGFEKYHRRIYSVGQSREFSIEIVTLIDFRAAYSLLTLLRNSNIQDGPPGDAYAADSESIRFFQGRKWIHISGRNIAEDLMMRVAATISHNLGNPGQKPPALVSHFPELGYDASNLHYFPGLKSFERFSGSNAIKSLNLSSDAEIAQTRYAVNEQAGDLSLLNFPTPEVAEAYFADLPDFSIPKKEGNRTYAKRAGPIVAVLIGSFDPETADRILGSLRYSYSVQWIYEKPGKSREAWGIPVSILHTVVKSLLFVALLAVIAFITGAGSAILRFVVRGKLSKNAPDSPERTDINRLRLR